ncbi:TPA: hypothetical protein DCG86_01640 [Candidatus Marinimicrobia bacterium]|nr:hypothetical protein [Candidatus Neomarinimicrobiota bacterium]HBY17939.1 hypothetical protein [Candidatus Neomarinimicrobiota bacterium]
MLNHRGLYHRKTSHAKPRIHVSSGILVPNTDHILQIVDGDPGVDFSYDNRRIHQHFALLP